MKYQLGTHYQSVFPLKNGDFIVSIPRVISENDKADISALLDILLKMSSRPFIPQKEAP